MVTTTLGSSAPTRRANRVVARAFAANMRATTSPASPISRSIKEVPAFGIVITIGSCALWKTGGQFGYEVVFVRTMGTREFDATSVGETGDALKIKRRAWPDFEKRRKRGDLYTVRPP